MITSSPVSTWSQASAATSCCARGVALARAHVDERLGAAASPRMRPTSRGSTSRPKSQGVARRQLVEQPRVGHVQSGVGQVRLRAAPASPRSRRCVSCASSSAMPQRDGSPASNSAIVSTGPATDRAPPSAPVRSALGQVVGVRDRGTARRRPTPGSRAPSRRCRAAPARRRGLEPQSAVASSSTNALTSSGRWCRFTSTSVNPWRSSSVQPVGEQRSAGDRHETLRHRLGERPQARAQTGGQQERARARHAGAARARGRRHEPTRRTTSSFCIVRSACSRMFSMSSCSWR